MQICIMKITITLQHLKRLQEYREAED